MRRVRFTVRRLMAVVAVAAIILWPLHDPGVFLALGLGGLVLAFTCWPEKPNRAPSTEFLCALIGMIIGAVFMPAKVNYRPTNDLRDYMDGLWIIGGAIAGALVGTMVAWADRRIVSRR